MKIFYKVNHDGSITFNYGRLTTYYFYSFREAKMAFRREYGLVGKHIEFVKEDGNLYSAVMKALHYAD